MTREQLSQFIHAAEHSHTLRQKIKQCKSKENLLELAASYRFSLSMGDLEDDGLPETIEEWFKKSQIPPIKKHK